MGKKVYIDEDECVGCGACEELCPDVFKVDVDTEIAGIIQSEVDSEECIEEAMETCPVDCIHWEE
jgi:ferredoxin